MGLYVFITHISGHHCSLFFFSIFLCFSLSVTNKRPAREIHRSLGLYSHHSISGVLLVLIAAILGQNCMGVPTVMARNTSYKY